MDNSGFATGWRPDTVDSRDKSFEEFVKALSDDISGKIWTDIVQELKYESYSLDASCPEIYNKFQLNSCVANAVSAALRFENFVRAYYGPIHGL